MNNDTQFFNDAFMAFCWRHKRNFDGRFCDLTIEQQRTVLAYAQTLKDADALKMDAIREESGSGQIQGQCCMARHANATAPWTCDCPCHDKE